MQVAWRSQHHPAHNVSKCDRILKKCQINVFLQTRRKKKVMIILKPCSGDRNLTRRGGNSLNNLHSISRGFLILVSLLITACAQQSTKADRQSVAAVIQDHSPDQEWVERPLQRIKEIPAVRFSEGSSRLSTRARKQISKIAHLLNRPDLATRPVIITGHSDTLGDEEKNLVLSRKRAEAVSRELILNGVRDSRLSIRAMGEAQPLVKEVTEDGEIDPHAMSINRRVEVSVGELQLVGDQL